MKITQLINGSPTIVLVPENEMEELFLKSFTKMPIEATAIVNATKILDHQVDKGLIIKTKVDNVNTRVAPSIE